MVYGDYYLVGRLNKGGMAELIRDGEDGLHAVPGDPEDWERVLRRLLEESELVSRLTSANSRNTCMALSGCSFRR